jgi:hypothetical protein
MVIALGGCTQFVLEADTLTETMKEAFKAGKLEAKYIGNAGGGGGLAPSVRLCLDV